MTLIISRDVSERMPGLHVLTARFSLPAQGEHAESCAFQRFSELWQERGAELAGRDPKDDPEMQPWVQLWKMLGVSLKHYPPSIFSLLKRAARGLPPPAVNPVVDCYNALSLELKLPFGAFDAAALSGPLRLRESAGGEEFLAIGADMAERTVVRELVYADDTAILTRHFLWRQSRQASIGPQTREIVLVCEILQEHVRNLHRIRELCELRITEYLAPDKVEWMIRP